MGIGEAKAIDELREYFRSLYLSPNFNVSFVNELPHGGTREGTLLCLGGPDTSLGSEGIIADLWRRATTSFVWGDPAQHDITIYDRESGEHFAPEGFPENVTRDYALIVKMPNPYAQPDTGHWVILFAGCLGYGTWGAVRFATTDAFVKDPRIAEADSVECLLSVEVAAGAPRQTQLICVRPLRDVSASHA
jgi:hypothetical protein